MWNKKTLHIHTDAKGVSTRYHLCYVVKNNISLLIRFFNSIIHWKRNHCPVTGTNRSRLLRSYICCYAPPASYLLASGSARRFKSYLPHNMFWWHLSAGECHSLSVVCVYSSFSSPFYIFFHDKIYCGICQLIFIYIFWTIYDNVTVHRLPCEL